MEQLGTKSSNEILTELFGAFNAEPPIDDEVSSRDRKKSKKSKKSKKKKKSKKHKRKRATSSSSESLSSEGDKKKSKKSRKLEVPVIDVPKTLDLILDEIPVPAASLSQVELPSPHNESENGFAGVKVKQELVEEESVTNGDKENGSSSEWDKSEAEPAKNISQERRADIFVEPEPETGLSEQKKGKIVIPNLKNSAVFQETIRAVEEKQKQEEEKKAKYEEGELSESSSSSDDDAGDKEKSPCERKSRSSKKSRNKRSHSRDDRTSSSSKRHRRSHSRSRHGSPRSRSGNASWARRRSKSRESRHSRHYDSRSSTRSDRDSRTSVNHPSRSEASRSRSDRDRKSSREREKPKNFDPEHKKSSRDKRKEISKAELLDSHDDDKIDKKKLLAIARKNAKKLVDAGIVAADKLSTLAVGGKTVNELTEYCKKLSKKEALGEDLSDIESNTSEEDDKPFHHPFQVRDRPNSIVMNIRNATSLPLKSMQEKVAEKSSQLRLLFPVSSGNTHRLTESEWVPVEPTKEVKPVKAASAVAAPPLSIMPPPLPPPALLTAVPPPVVAAPVFPVIQPSQPSAPVQAEGAPAAGGLDISEIVSKRLNALRQLQEDPKNRTAKQQISRTQSLMDQWVRTDRRGDRPPRQETGEFTGTTGARVLSAAELSAGAQAWAKRDQLMTAQPVTGGMGMTLLQKMGWQPGEGLGKNKEGSLEPLRLQVKTDKKGLVAWDEAKNAKNLSKVGPVLPTVKTLDGKHPVSLLNEYCSRRRWGIPTFELAFECGPDHKKNFLFKVKVNGVEYQPTVASVNKKQAKAEAAAICLRALGLISAPPDTSTSEQVQ